ncbi:zinc finger protein 93-like [Culex pipiens pallens]|uniref:zinc finger protein 93-like n=1 Tax=Culex pipiens pallens TaxID=42434 RepID=UPI0019546B05|nr:zinc finger protein 93-like [Culex pipiens pallens]
MSPTELQSCLTCFRHTGDYLRINASRSGPEGTEDIGAVFEKHFWFTQDEYRDKIVCASCWEKIDEFNKFYCEVEKVYRPKLKEEFVEATGIDEDQPMMMAEDSLADTFCKTEIEERSNEESMSESNSINGEKEDANDSESSDSDSDSESSMPLAKRKASVKRKKRQRVRKDDEVMEIMEYPCHICVQSNETSFGPFSTWYRMILHFKKVHQATGYYFCCGRKFYTKKGYLGHSVNHEKIEKRRCDECDITFKDDSGLARHMELVHKPEEEKQFKCEQCSKAFAEEELLSCHIKWHQQVETRNNHCAICDRYFVGQGNLAKHNAAHHSGANVTRPVAQPAIKLEASTYAPLRKTPSADEMAKQNDLIKQLIVLNCSQCDFIGETFVELARHARTEHDMKSHPITCCDKRFNTRLRLYEHCLMHQNPDWFKCECGKTFRDSDGLKHHKWWIHTPVSERPFKCDVCGDAFMKDYQLKSHMDRHLDRERKRYSCKQCTNVYTSMIQLKSHQQRIHGAMSDWVCDVCAKGFTHRALLVQHRLTHTEEGLKSLKVQCEKCLRWLCSKRSLYRHKMLCGNNTGPVKCDQCDHVSVHSIALEKHVKMNHTDVRKYACSYCGKEFKKQIRLKEHEANHAGIVLYKCEFCPRECNSSSNMYTHKKTAHPEQWGAVMAAKYSY